MVAFGLLTAVSVPVWAQIRTGRRGRSGPSVKTSVIEEDSTKELKRQQRACQAAIARARQYIAQKKWGSARQSLDRAGALAVDNSQSSAITMLYKQVEKQGRRRLLLARQAQSRGNFAVAMEAYDRIGREFGMLPSGVSARNAHKALRYNPRVQKAMRESKADILGRNIDALLYVKARATTQPADAQGKRSSRVEQIRKLPVNRQAKLVGKLERLARGYASTSAGKRASADLESLRQDESLWSALQRYRRGSRAESLLKLARSYRAANAPAKAIEIYERIVSDYSDTPGAAKAAAAITALRPSE